MGRPAGVAPTVPSACRLPSKVAVHAPPSQRHTHWLAPVHMDHSACCPQALLYLFRALLLAATGLMVWETVEKFTQESEASCVQRLGNCSACCCMLILPPEPPSPLAPFAGLPPRTAGTVIQLSPCRGSFPAPLCPPISAGVHAPGCADGGERVCCLRLPLAHSRHGRPAGLARAQGCVPAAALPEQRRRLGVAGTVVSWVHTQLLCSAATHADEERRL